MYVYREHTPSRHAPRNRKAEETGSSAYVSDNRTIFQGQISDKKVGALFALADPTFQPRCTQMAHYMRDLPTHVVLANTLSVGLAGTIAAVGKV